MQKPLLCLEDDLAWDDSRPRPIEPYRFGIIRCNDPIALSNEYAEILPHLNQHSWQGCYIHPNLLRGKHPMLRIARQFLRQGDETTACILGSLTFSPQNTRKIANRVQRDLAAIQLGPNKEYINKVISCIDKDEDFKRHLIELSKERDISICDPFGGGGVLCYALAEYINALTEGAYKITLIDITDVGYLEAQPLIQRFYKHWYASLSPHITFVQGNGFTLAEGIVNNCDIIVSTMALHEHVSTDVKKFFKNAASSIVKGGKIIVVDATREPSILKKAQTRLPILGRLGMSFLSLQYFLKGKPNRTFAHLVHSAIRESRWLSESGIRSYACGYLKEELEEMATSAGLDKNSLMVRYDRTPPVGSIVLEYKG